MRIGRSAGRGTAAAAFAAVTALLSGVGGGGDACVARAQHRTFNISLVGHLNPLPAPTNNLYADLAAEGNVVVLGSVGAGSGVAIINNTNPAAPSLYTRYMPTGNENGQFRDVILRNKIGYFA